MSLVVALAIAAGFFVFFKKSAEAPQTIIEEIKDEVLPPPEQTLPAQNENSSGAASQTPVTLPGKISIEVPFTSQAPFANWDERHEEACEEASIVMLKYYLDGKQLTPEIAEQEIQKVIDFQIRKHGDYRDTNAQKTVAIAEDLYGLKSLKVVYDFQKEDLKRELAKGNPVIIPAAGRELGNPYFTQPGPLYHMLMLTGYSGNQIITNDPGTRRGEGYRYNIDVLYNAIHDFPGDKEKIGEGGKAMIVLEKQ